MYRKKIICKECGELQRHEGRGLCQACWKQIPEHKERAKQKRALARQMKLKQRELQNGTTEA